MILWKFIMRVRVDGCTGSASMPAYSFFPALPAVLILMVAALTHLPVENLSDKIGEHSPVTIAPAVVGGLSGDMGTWETLALWLGRVR